MRTPTLDGKTIPEPIRTTFTIGMWKAINGIKKVPEIVSAVNVDMHPTKTRIKFGAKVVAATVITWEMFRRLVRRGG